MSDFPEGPRPAPRDTSFFADPMIDHLLRAVVSLTMELSVTRERLQSVEMTLETLTPFERAKIDALKLPPEVEQSRAQQRRALIEEVLGPMVSRLANP
jgi:hypothetical protein